MSKHGVNTLLSILLNLMYIVNDAKHTLIVKIYSYESYINLC